MCTDTLILAQASAYASDSSSSLSSGLQKKQSALSELKPKQLPNIEYRFEHVVVGMGTKII